MNPFLALIGSIGTPEILVILIVGLLLFGARLPEVGRSLGKSLLELKRGLQGVKDDVYSIDREADRRVDEELRRRESERASRQLEERFAAAAAGARAAEPSGSEPAAGDAPGGDPSPDTAGGDPHPRFPEHPPEAGDPASGHR